MDAEEIMRDSIREYNEFGTWIIKITDESGIPKLFKSHYREKSIPVLLIKIPRRIERRLASPWMDLYDSMIGLFDTYLYILIRNGKTVEEKRIGYEEIISIQKTHALLKGELIFFLQDEIFKVPYNTVSDDIIVELINIVQKKRQSGESETVAFETISVEYDPKKPGSMDLHLVNLTNKVILADPQMKLVAYQMKVNVGVKPKELIKRVKLLFKFRKRSFFKASFLSDGSRLVMVKCDETVRNKAADGYNYSATYLRIEDITDIKTADYGLPMVKSMEIEVRGNSFGFVFDEKNQMIWNLYSKLKRYV